MYDKGQTTVIKQTEKAVFIVTSHIVSVILTLDAVPHPQSPNIQQMKQLLQPTVSLNQQRPTFLSFSGTFWTHNKCLSSQFMK